ncbi:MAG: hypothetical protein PHP45_05765 [Elusimicrobiales bacterium]|nr:hypothetical protein [Elusimicrobiales bacterium]
MTVSNTEMEKFFSELCKNAPMHEPRPVWPAIAARLGRGEKTAVRKLVFAAACAVSVAVLLAVLPGLGRTAADVARRIFNCAYSFGIGGREAGKGTFLLLDGGASSMEFPDGKIEASVASHEGNAVLITAKVYRKDASGGLQLISRPKVLTLKGREAMIAIGDGNGRQLFSLKMTPSEKENGYRTKLEKPLNK